MEDAKEEIDSIVSAAKAGKVAEVKWFLECGENVNATAGSTKRTALHEAAMNGHCDCIVWLLSAGAELEARDTLGYTPLHVAITKRQTDAIKLLLDRGANIYAVDDKNRDSLSLADTFCGRTSELTKYLVARELEIKKMNPPTQYTKGLSLAQATKEPPQETSHVFIPAESVQAKPSSISVDPTRIPTDQQNHPTHKRLPPSFHQHTNYSSSGALVERRPASSSSRIQFVVIVYKESAVAVVRMEEENEFLSDIRERMARDDICFSFPFRFLFQTTGAPVTQKQEQAFPVNLCCYLKTTPVQSGMQFIDIANVQDFDPTLWHVDDSK